MNDVLPMGKLVPVGELVPVGDLVPVGEVPVGGDCGRWSRLKISLYPVLVPRFVVQ